MNPSRFIAFYDAVLAIIMTIIVLNLDMPDPGQWSGLLSVISQLFCYAISFFWLGLMWISSYQAWQHIEKVSGRSLFFMLISLFFSSFFPFATSFVAQQFDALPAQVFYGMTTILITLANVVLTYSLNNDHKNRVLGSLFMLPPTMVKVDLAIKIIALLLAPLWPPLVTVGIFLAVTLLGVRLFLNMKDCPSWFGKTSSDQADC